MESAGKHTGSCPVLKVQEVLILFECFMQSRLTYSIAFFPSYFSVNIV